MASHSWSLFGVRLAFPEVDPVPRVPRRYLGVAAGILAGLVVVQELRSSWLESRILSAVDARATFSVASGSVSASRYWGTGPYDERLGYAMLPAFINRLEARGYQVASRANPSRVSGLLRRLGLFPIYHEKTQAGLQILDRDGAPLYAARYPGQVYPDFNSIPPLVVTTLLFIENRGLLDAAHPYRNPALEWSRLTRAAVDLGIHSVDHAHPFIGGSTLATQLEKMRHSPGGRTTSIGEKLRQVASASLRAYEDGPDTLNSQQR